MRHWKKKTAKALNANIEALQSSKSALDAQAQQTKLQIVREKMVQMGLAHDTVEQRAAASTSEAFAKEQAKVEGFACRNELKELSKEKEAAKKKSWKFGRMEAMANGDAFNLSTFGGVGRSRSLFGNSFPGLSEMSSRGPHEHPVLPSSFNSYHERSLQGGGRPPMNGYGDYSYDNGYGNASHATYYDGTAHTGYYDGNAHTGYYDGASHGRLQGNVSHGRQNGNASYDMHHGNASHGRYDYSPDGHRHHNQPSLPRHSRRWPPLPPPSRTVRKRPPQPLTSSDRHEDSGYRRSRNRHQEEQSHGIPFVDDTATCSSSPNDYYAAGDRDTFSRRETLADELLQNDEGGSSSYHPQNSNGAPFDMRVSPSPRQNGSTSASLAAPPASGMDALWQAIDEHA